MSLSILDPENLKRIIKHVFFPLQLPDWKDSSIDNDHSLAGAIAAAAHLYHERIDRVYLTHWRIILRMLGNLQAIVASQSLGSTHIISQLSGMDVGAFRIRAQNAGVIFRKQANVTIFESFELSPKVQVLNATKGKLICSYPGLAIEIPSLVFDDKEFRHELINFLVHMNRDHLDDVVTNPTAPPSVFQDTVHPRFITELLTGILRSVGRPADIVRISKRVGDESVWNGASELPWRSPFWLLIRVALQTTLDRSPLGHRTYKEFILFFMCFLAEERNCAELPTDLLQFMQTKISRRLRKLGSSAPDWLSHTVLQACTSLRSIIENRWQLVQATQRLSPPWTPSQLDLARDTQLSLFNSGGYLQNTLTNRAIIPPDVLFDPDQVRHRGVLDDFLSSNGRSFIQAYDLEPNVALYDVERAVELEIDTWIGGVLDNDDACAKLETLAEKYSSSASNTYVNNPELLSVMLLTMVEFWIALDKIAIKEIPMLADYSPEVSGSLLERLLVPRATNLRRLRRAHEYLSHRHSQSRERWSVFSSIITLDSFAVRFYRNSLRLQRLKHGILPVFRNKFPEIAANPRTATGHHTETGHLHRQVGIWDRIREWLWPTNQLLAEVVVFELYCPTSFDIWRTSTFHLLTMLSYPFPQQDLLRVQLNHYRSIQSHRPMQSGSQIRPSSPARLPYFSRSGVPIPTQHDWVRVKYGLKLFSSESWTGAFALQHPKHCAYKLQHGPYENLQVYVDSTSHTSNEVIANQEKCHKDLSIHEYMALGQLRNGGLLQWPNILRELHSRSLSFRRPEVHMLLAQAVSQVGPFKNKELTWHQEIQQPSFCHALLRELESLVSDVEANWMEGVTMDTISFLLRRLLASSPDDVVSVAALNLLRAVRSKVFSWTQELTVKLLRTSGNEELRGILRDVAAICRGTFDVGPAMISTVLHSAEDAETLLSSAIIIHDHMPNDGSHVSEYSQLLLDRDRRLSLSLQTTVTDIILTDSNGIDLAIRRIWPGYHPGSKWRTLRSSKSHWFYCRTSPPVGQRPQAVHFNILDGSLLINGKSFGTWLPQEVMSHSLYRLLFGKKLFEVLASDLPGMDYSTKNLVDDHQVHFSLRDGGWDLVIQARRMRRNNDDDSGIIELIPHERLYGDLPTVLREGHVHWLNLSTSIMEIRPLDSLWETSSENWRVDCTPGHYHMWKGFERLIDIRSQSWSMISSLLKPLAPLDELVISVSQIDPNQPTSSLQLSVLLPHYDLSFYVDEDGNLASRDIRDMVYDENQSFGTFFGLVNQLVLRPKAEDVNIHELIPRCVLIPDGDISLRKNGHHVHVDISPHRSVQNRVTYQSYRINAELGCLVGNGSLTSKLYCAYLHALTSGCGDDPLTGRSGTEEALSVLRSASCLIMNFSPRDAALLALIASICPSRMSYSNKLTVRKVAWRTLPTDSQYHEFCILANVIKERHKMVQLFYDRPSSVSSQGSPSEETRDHVRVPMCSTQQTVVRVCPLLVSDQSVESSLDDYYHARNLFDKPASGEHRAYIAATCVNRRTATSAKDIWNMVERWTNNVSGDAIWSLRYSKLWLDPDLPSIWLKVYNLLRKSDESKWFELLFSLPAMAYASVNLAELVPVFVAFASHSQFRAQDPPSYHASYSIQDGCHPTLDALHAYVVHCPYPPKRTLPRATRQIYDARRRERTNKIIQMFLDTWPHETPSLGLIDHALFDVAHLKREIDRYLFSCSRNLELKEHLNRVQTILNGLHESPALPTPDTSSYTFSPPRSFPSHIPRRLPVLNELFSRPAAPLQTHHSTDALAQYLTGARGGTSPPDSTSLHRLLATVETDSNSSFQHKYVSALRISAESFDSGIFLAERAMKSPSAETLIEHYVRCKTGYIVALRHIQKSLGPRNESEEAVERAGLWPRITAYVLHQCLASNSSDSLSDDWRRCIIKFALLALELQRARRMVLLRFDDLHEELFRELQNEGCDGWDAEAHPEWLLIQLQGNFSIRRVQAEVANEMISPRSGNNTAMQLNMGEGKSSVIIPIAAAALANGEQLVRVIVPKPLTTQTLHLLTDRLCGLTNRRIFYLPFSRSLEIDHQKVVSLHQLMLECMRERGILVAQPDHVLSLRLASMDKQLSRGKDDKVAHLLLELQRWLHSHSRDLLDESDEILDTRSQLVFTIGNMRHVDGSPERWTITQQVLGLVNKHASSLRNIFPLGVEYEPGTSGSFPHFRILQKIAGEKLLSWVIEDIMDGHLPDVSFGQLHSHPGLEDAIRMFISCGDIPSEKAQLIKNSFEKTPLWRCLLLLRGLLAAGILLYTLKERRWRVDYGLDTTRTMLAVPYRAKDVPAQRAEFSHPDIAIILTCLSYYYIGLTEDQVKLSFETLFEKHVPSQDYELWVQACPDIPEFLRTLRGVNVESMEQWDTLYLLFSRNRETINFYLSNVVFPKEAKECPSKLPSSGWDLSEKKNRPVTGFSGTNDGQHLFPLHIAQRDLENQGGTNAKVLWYLLRPENNYYACTSHPNGERRTTREFLQLLVSQKPEIRVLLDVGAQMLDLQNHELVQTWLDISPGPSAAIYFNEQDELMVCTRDGSTQLLRSSPFAQQIDRCVVYLDDAHTRGTDIRFPTGFRGAVTLGPKVTKDRLVQGCMRMRKLGHGHSIMFFAPLGVDLRIRSVAGKDKDPSDMVNSTDILHWAIRETWENIRRWAPHWVQQGIEHASRYSAWSDFCADQLGSEELARKWLLPEAARLENFFDLRDPLIPVFLSSPDIRQRCEDLGVMSLSSLAGSMDEEGERELAYEVRRERQVQPQFQPAALILPLPAIHSIHPAVVDFIRTGVIPRGPNCFGTRNEVFIPAMETLQGTPAASDESYIWSQSVLVTADFAKTVQASGMMGNYLRPVQWIISANRGTGHVLVILSPYEATCLLPEIKSSGKVHLHLYTPRTTKSMKSCDDLSLYSIPMVPDEWIPPSPQLMDQLSMFAGQLYLKDYASYIRICRFLGVYARDLQGKEEIVTQPDGFILPKDRNRFKHSRTEIAHTFAATPLVSLRALMKLRRKGFDYSSTHLGKLFHGRLFTENDFEK